MFQSTQTSFVDGRTSLVKAKRNEAIAAFIYNDFVDKALPPTTAPRLYVNNQMPDDLQAAEKLAVATIFGTGSRFQFAAPKCRLSRDADPDLGNVSSPADCMRFGQTTLRNGSTRYWRWVPKLFFDRRHQHLMQHQQAA